MTQLIPTFHPLFAERLQRRNNSDVPELWNMLDTVCDPELPGVTLWDLGVLQDIKASDSTIEVAITLTYSGCPAVHTMKQDIEHCLSEKYPDHVISITVLLSPAWCTDMMSPEAKKQLQAIYIAAPTKHEDQIYCPLCGSQRTTLLSQFGSTSCKALYRCESCLETFDYFKSL